MLIEVCGICGRPHSGDNGPTGENWCWDCCSASMRAPDLFYGPEEDF